MKRYEREISELLEKLDDFIPDDRPRRREPRRWQFAARVRRAIQWPLSGRIRLDYATLGNITPNSLIVASIVMGFVAYFLHDVFRPAAPLASIASVALLLAALAMNLTRRHRSIEQRWRGQVIDLDDYRPGNSLPLAYWWRKIKKALRRGPWRHY